MRRSTAAVALADALDARRVPATWLIGPQPHPEVAAWATARRRVGDAVLLHGTRTDVGAGRPYRRLPAHEAGLRLAGALRSRDVLGLAVDGFARPGVVDLGTAPGPPSPPPAWACCSTTPGCTVSPPAARRPPRGGGP